MLYKTKVFNIVSLKSTTSITRSSATIYVKIHIFYSSQES
nr:MAG TPA: hypothetical protein [Caudoviricetes sp.]